MNVLKALRKLNPLNIFGGNGKPSGTSGVAGKPTRAALESAVAAPDFEMQLAHGTVTVRKLRHYEAEELFADLGKLLPEATGEENWLAAIGAMLKGGAGLAAVPAKVRDRIITAHTGLTAKQIGELYYNEPYAILQAIYLHHIREDELLMDFFARGVSTLLPLVKNLLAEVLGPELSTKLFSEPSSDTPAPK